MLSIKNLSKAYGGTKKAVDNLSIDVENGDIYGFIGHN
ncbi:MAG: ABC transporter ATP-binding protein, partial [Clostridia bacterium]